MATRKKLIVFAVVACGLTLLIVSAVLMRDWLLDQWYFHQLNERSDGRYIAGVVFGHDGRRVAGASVQCCGERLTGPRRGYQFGGELQRRMRTVTDAKGRFTLADVEKGIYHLRFSAPGQATFIRYEVPDGTSGRFKFTRGATLAGRVVAASTREPVVGAVVKLEQASRLSYSHLGFDADQTTVTDSAGRFRFDHLRAIVRDSYRETYSPREWEVSSGNSRWAIFLEEGGVRVKARSVKDRVKARSVKAVVFEFFDQ